MTTMRNAMTVALLLHGFYATPHAHGKKPPSGWARLAFEGEEPIGSFKDIVAKLAAPHDETGAPMDVKELRAILDDARTRDIYRSELVKYASPQSVKIQNAQHKSFVEIFLKKERVAQGAAFLAANREALERAETKFGVKREDIVSVLMWESNLGKITGKYLVVNTYLGEILFLEEVFAELEKKNGVMPPGPERDLHMKRLARLRENAAKFLVALLRSTKAKNVDPLEIRGSWAGAIGFPQFMPTSMKYAIDGNEDGHIDLYSFADAIPSIANYLAEHGYAKDRFAAIFAYNNDSEYVNGVMAYADAVAKKAAAPVKAAAAGPVKAEPAAAPVKAEPAAP